MSHLLDINVLLACAWVAHPEHTRINRWLDSVTQFATAPLTQMGFLRVSMSPAYAATFTDAITALQAIVELKSHRFLADSIEAGMLPNVLTSQEVTDAHLIRLAGQHALKLATLDKILCRKRWATGIAECPVP